MPLNTQNLTGREDLKSIYDFNRYLSVVWGGREGDCNVAVSLAITEPHSEEDALDDSQCGLVRSFQVGKEVRRPLPMPRQNADLDKSRFLYLSG